MVHPRAIMTGATGEELEEDILCTLAGMLTCAWHSAFCNLTKEEMANSLNHSKITFYAKAGKRASGYKRAYASIRVSNWRVVSSSWHRFSNTINYVTYLIVDRN